MKLRTHGRLSAAINEIKVALTEKKCAQIVERSESLIRKWADPDDPALPNLRQSILLDAAYMRGGFGEAPIQSWYMDKLEAIVGDDPKDAPSILVSTLNAQAALGQIASSVARLTASGSSRGNAISSNERSVLMGLIENLARNLDSLENSLQEDMRVSGPIALSQFLQK